MLYLECIFPLALFTEALHNFAINTQAQYSARDDIILKNCSGFSLQNIRKVLLVGTKKL